MLLVLLAPQAPPGVVPFDGNTCTLDGDIFREGRVGIGATGAPQSVLDVQSSDSGVLVPRLGEGSVITPLPGMVIFDTDDQKLKYYDGAAWVTVDEPEVSDAGQIKINGFNTTGVTQQPEFEIPASPENAPLTFVRIVYDGLDVNDNPSSTVQPGNIVLAAPPTTSFPANGPTDSTAIYDTATDRFIENSVEGQVNIWRVDFNYSERAGNGGTTFVVRLENPNPQSTFVIESALTVTGDNANDQREISIVLITIADSLSLPSPQYDGGYEISIGADDAARVTVTSVTRISLRT
ncbi:hypothetical protein [Parahalioglobus pacificus]|uniref:Uncharacterized protein n=1 Tax=Parahalioglobus pacificus TaxID=930806 RepID=A0A919CHF8_9GAMM|nr:hypothetical protein [Halioglobus pacificus]GHD25619.1 hypothetical protein GCM10007053_01660 [Halioglobus pacificus]